MTGKNLVAAFALASSVFGYAAESAKTISIDGNEYAVDTLIERTVGPGTRYMRLRLPDYPLNVNMLMVDVTNHYVAVETTQANEKLFGTERLVDAAERQSAPGHRAIGGANANFWCVSTSYPYSDLLIGTTFNANLRNGKIITETNCHADQWDRGPSYIGEAGMTADGRFMSDHFAFYAEMRSEATGAVEIHGANKVVRDNELVMYNSYFGDTRSFKCADMVWRDQSNRWGFDVVDRQATEVRLRLADGAEWSAGRDIALTVVDITDNAGNGMLGDTDLALVARGDRRDALRKLKAGDTVTLNYTWKTLDGTPIEFTNMIGGNGQVMINGELTEVCTISENCALVYSKTGYGASADNKTMYIIVIDKSTDPVYGASAGCTSAVMCQIARHYGCSNLTNVDSGGSAQLYTMGRVVNKTTEATPRAVANGMFVYSTAPDDDVVTSIAFDKRRLTLPVCTSTRPRVLGYNRYGALVTDNLEGVTYECDEAVGRITDYGFEASNEPATGTLTARYGDAVATCPVEIVYAELAFRIHDIIIDGTRRYPIELVSEIGGETFGYDPAAVQWTISDESTPGVCAVDNNGVLTGLKEGTAKLTATIDRFTDTANISVEIPETEYVVFDTDYIHSPSDWNLSKTGIKNETASAGEGAFPHVFDYTVSSARGVKLTLNTPMRLHSLPDAVRFSVDPRTTNLVSVAVAVKPANVNANRTKTIAIADVTPGADGTYTFDVPFDELFDTNDLICYPVELRNIQLIPAGKTGTYSIAVSHIEAHYAGLGAVDDIIVDGDNDVDPYAADAAWYTTAGVRIDGATAAPGIYIVRQGAKVVKIGIK